MRLYNFYFPYGTDSGLDAPEAGMLGTEAAESGMASSLAT